MFMTEVQVQEFWQNHSCGETLVGGLHATDDAAFEKFFNLYVRVSRGHQTGRVRGEQSRG